MIPVIRTARLVLRALVEADAEAIFVARGDPEVCRYWSGPPHRDVEETRASLHGVNQGKGSTTWAITGPLGDEALGWVTLMHVRDGVDELGYLLRKQQWGHGYAREGVAAVIGHAFEALGKHRLSADIDPRNHASIRLVRQLGFVHEGLLRENWLVAGERCDSVIYGLLVQQWRASRAKAGESRIDAPPPSG
ncbi:MAG: GNAT family N-acetyltransferase [Deltaproteobacteria bacterium]|nr:GNAT family N-acetyltransferase [Deltaproteobacteria bacterium]